MIEFNLLDQPHRQVTIPMVINAQAQRYGDRVLLKDIDNPTKPPLTWRALNEGVSRISWFLREHGCKPGDRVLHAVGNSIEALIWELGAITTGCISAALPPNADPHQIAAQIQHLEVKLLFVADVTAVSSIDLPDRISLVALHPLPSSPSLPRWTSWAALMTTDCQVPPYDSHANRCCPDAACHVVFTSGSTGEPKGVVINQQNIISQQLVFRAKFPFTNRDVTLSYLPWHHSFGGLLEKYLVLFTGATMTLTHYEGTASQRFISAWKATRPTAFFSVPKVLDNLMINAQADPELQTCIADNLRFIHSGSAPLPEATYQYFTTLGVTVIEGWGLTETSPCVTLTEPTLPRSLGAVGFPIPGVEIALAEDHEILVKGPNVMTEYFGDPEGTASALCDGWFRTGDIGELLPSGELRVVGRRDGILKLSNGEKIRFPVIEQVLLQSSDLIAHVVAVLVQGERVGVLIFPLVSKVAAFFDKSEPMATEELETYCYTPQFLRLMRSAICKANSRLSNHWEHIACGVVIPHELTVEAELLTPSFKPKRAAILSLFTLATQALEAQSAAYPVLSVEYLKARP